MTSWSAYNSDHLAKKTQTHNKELSFNSQAKMTLNENPTAARQLMTIYQMIFKNLQNGISKGISTLLLATGLQGKLMKMQVWQV